MMLYCQLHSWNEINQNFAVRSIMELSVTYTVIAMLQLDTLNLWVLFFFFFQLISFVLLLPLSTSSVVPVLFI